MPSSGMRGRKPSSFNETVYLVLKSGFLSRVHRHEDDLSIILYGHGEDWLIDSGLYRYQEDDPLRRDMRSAPAHNIAIVDDVPQIRGAEGVGRSRIESFRLQDGTCVGDRLPRTVSRLSSASQTGLF